jgi:hypothetical protein
MALQTVTTESRVNVSIRKARAEDVPLLVALEREFDRDERQPVLKSYHETSKLVRPQI